MMGALLWHVAARKREGKASNIAKNGIPFPERKLALHLKTKGVTEEEVLQAIPQEPPLPPGFTCTTPPPRSTGQAYGISERPYPVSYPETGFPAPSEVAKVPLGPSREAPFTPHVTRRSTPAWLATLEMDLDYSPTQSRYDFQSDGTFEDLNSGLLQGMDLEPWEPVGLHTSGTQDQWGIGQGMGTAYQDFHAGMQDPVMSAQVGQLVAESSRVVESTQVTSRREVDLKAGASLAIPPHGSALNCDSTALGATDIEPWTVVAPPNTNLTNFSLNCKVSLPESHEAVGKFPGPYAGESDRSESQSEELDDGQLETRTAEDARLLQAAVSSTFGFEPEAFTAFCYLSCTLQAQNRKQEAELVASKAFEICKSLIRGRHWLALTCLNLVFTVLFLHGRSEDATLLLKGARKAALTCLDGEDPIVETINFMIAQSCNIALECGPSVARLRLIYEHFRETESPRHPYTVLAGCKLAWRLSFDDGNVHHRWEAIYLLTILQDSADEVLGITHTQSISLMDIKGRILYELGRFPEAERVLSTALKRIENEWHPLDPFGLEMKRRYANLLHDIGRRQEAEKLWTEVALGKTVCLGHEHPWALSCVNEVYDFLRVPGREHDLAGFETDLARAVRRSTKSLSIFGH
jgi:tetratricopeptide (TPR) repeat protein